MDEFFLVNRVLGEEVVSFMFDCGEERGGDSDRLYLGGEV